MPNYLTDAQLELKDAGAVTADGAATVGGNARTIDVGPGKLRDGACVEVRISANDFADTDELWTLRVQGSNDAFSAAVDLATLPIPGGQTGLTRIHFTNELFGTVYREIRIFHDIVAGATTPSINYTARLTGPV
jgi:hypothetical protein